MYITLFLRARKSIMMGYTLCGLCAGDQYRDKRPSNSENCGSVQQWWARFGCERV